MKYHLSLVIYNNTTGAATAKGARNILIFNQRRVNHLIKHCFESKLESIDLEGASRRYNGRYPFKQKFRKISKLGQMIRKFPGKVSVKSGNYWIAEKRTIQPMIGVKSNGTEILGKKFPKISLHLACNCNFIRHRKFPEIQTGIFHQMESALFVTPRTKGTNACNLMNQTQPAKHIYSPGVPSAGKRLYNYIGLFLLLIGWNRRRALISQSRVSLQSETVQWMLWLAVYVTHTKITAYIWEGENSSSICF